MGEAGAEGGELRGREDGRDSDFGLDRNGSRG